MLMGLGASFFYVRSFAQIALNLASIAEDFHLRGWVVGTSGNLSAVVNREPLHLAMSPSGVDKGELTQEQILLIDEHARVLVTTQAKPSDESPLHVRIVKQRGAGAVLHTIQSGTPYSRIFTPPMVVWQLKVMRC